MFLSQSEFCSLPLFLFLVLLCNNHASALYVPAPIFHFGVGAVAGGAGAFAAYPFDYIKSQIQSENLGVEDAYENGWDAFQRTLSEEGPLQLYKGVGVQIVGIAPEKGIKLGTNDMILSSWVAATSSPTVPLWGQIVAGSIAGACQVLATSPLEVIKVGLQTSDRTLSEVIQEVEGGVWGLFRGADACMFRDVSFTAVCFPLYTYLLTQCGQNPFSAGAISGVVSAMVATPSDFVKTRILTGDMCAKEDRNALEDVLCDLQDMIMVEATADGAAVAALPPSTPPQQSTSSTRPFWAVARDILEEEGPGVFFTGAKERCLGAIPRFGVTLGMHEYFEHWAATHHLLS